MNLQEFRALDEFQRFDVLKELSGDELKAFAIEVAAEQGVSPMLRRIAASPNSIDATIKNQLKIELRKLSLTFQERQADMQVDAVEQPQEEFSWERIKGAPFIERKPTPINEAEKDAFLKQFYNGDVVEVDVANPLGNIAAVRAQVEAICQKMVGYGFRNFDGLKDKFADMAFNIEGEDQRRRDFSNAKQIKQVMESILYFVENAPEASRSEIVANYKDTQFACGDGTLQNLIDIFSEMQLGKSDIASYVALAKRIVVSNTFLPMYRQNYFHEAGLIFHPGNERHDIDSLINAVADEFGLVVRTQQEDRFIKDASRYREFLLGELNRVFAQPEVIENMSMFVANKIFENLRKFIDTKQPIKNQVQDFLTRLGFADRYSYFHLVNYNQLDLGSQELILLMVEVYFHERGMRKVLDIESHYQLLKIAGSHNAQYEQFITRENFPEEVEIDREAVKLVLFQNVELDEAQFGTKNQVLYFARKNKNVFAEFNLGHKQLKLLLNDVSAEELKDIEITGILLDWSLFYVTTPGQIDVLVAKGADLKMVSAIGNNVAKFAEVDGRKDMVAKFAEHGIAPINVFEGYENGVNPKHEEMVVNTISKMPNWLNHALFLKIIECGMVNVLKKALETPEGRKLLLSLDKDGNTALHHAARHPNPELFLEILKTEDGRGTLASYNDEYEKMSPIDVLINLDKVDLINAVLKTKEGDRLINKPQGNGNPLTMIESLYEDELFDKLKTLLKCNISLDPILKSPNTTKGMVQDAVDNNDFEAFNIFMERAELRNKLFTISLDGIEKLKEKGLLKPILEKHWLEILQSTDGRDLSDFIKVAAACGLFNEIINKLDEEEPSLLFSILNRIVAFHIPIADGVDEALSLCMSKTNVRKWVLQTDPVDPNDMHFKRLVAKGAAKTVDAILNDNFLRRACDLQDGHSNTFLHCVEMSYENNHTVGYYTYQVFEGADENEDPELRSRFSNCLREIADNQYLKAALPRLLAIKNGDGKTPLDLALTQMLEIFQILLDWSVRPENIASLHVLDNKGRTPFYNALLEGCDIATVTKFVNADASFVDSIFDHVDNEMVNVISRILDNENAQVAFGNVFELVKDNPVLMRKFIDSVGNESRCSSLEYARRYDMPTIVNAILTFAQDTSLGLSLPSASLEAQANASTAWIPSVGEGVDATVSIPTSVTSTIGTRRSRSCDLDDDNDYDDKKEVYKRRRTGGSPDRD